MIRMAAIIGIWAVVWMGIGYCLPGPNVVTEQLTIEDGDDTVLKVIKGYAMLYKHKVPTTVLTIESGDNVVTIIVPSDDWAIFAYDGAWEDD